MLEPDEENPVEVLNADLPARIVLCCDHASNAIPRSLDNMGLDQKDLERHIAVDIGAEVIARTLAKELALPCVLAKYSRLVIDTNRARDDGAFWVTSDNTVVPANQNMSEVDKEARFTTFYDPFHSAVDVAVKQSGAHILVAIHSFTPQQDTDEQPRPWHMGLSAIGDHYFTPFMQSLLTKEGYNAAIDQPYALRDFSGCTLEQHGHDNGINDLLLEIRQDLISDDKGRQAIIPHLLQVFKALDCEIKSQIDAA